MKSAIVFLMWVSSLGMPVSESSSEPVQAPGSTVSARVKVNVSAHEEIKQPIHEYITTGLQSLGTVQLVDEDPEWTIEVVTTRLEDAEGAMVAVGLSVIIQEHGPHIKMLLALAQACRYFIATGYLHGQPLEASMQRLLTGVAVLPQPDDLAVISQHSLCVITPERLPKACQDIVAGFDAIRLKMQGKDDQANAKDRTNPLP